MESDKANKTIEGERGAAAVTRRPMNPALKRFLSFAALLTVVVASATWGYRALLKSDNNAQAAQVEKIETSTLIPPRNFVVEPVPEQMSQPETSAPASPLYNEPVPAQYAVGGSNFGGNHPQSTHRQDRLDAPLSPGDNANMGNPIGIPVAANMSGGNPAYLNSPQVSGALGGMMNATSTPPRAASLIKNRNLMMMKGTCIECVLKTRVVSTVPGFWSCVVPKNIYSDNGRVVLIPRGSEIIGEHQGGMQQGQDRLAALGSRVKTPEGVLIDIDSLASDELGGSGLPGEVNNHWGQRIGGALLISLIDDAFATLAARQGRHDGTVVVYSNTSSTAQSVAQEVVKNTINIAPTLTKNQGEKISIILARDLDFSTVYALDLSER